MHSGDREHSGGVEMAQDEQGRYIEQLEDALNMYDAMALAYLICGNDAARYIRESMRQGKHRSAISKAIDASSARRRSSREQ